MKKPKPNPLTIVPLIALLMILVVFVVVIVNKSTPTSATHEEEAIILSPHLDDAVLSLGGFLAHTKEPTLIDTFFTGKPATSTLKHWDEISGFISSDYAIPARLDENNLALQMLGEHAINTGYLDAEYSENLHKRQDEFTKQIADNIRSLIHERTMLTHLQIYGPARFGKKITHLDHQILHNAFMSIAEETLNDARVSFYVYEDFPYTDTFLHDNDTTVQEFLAEKYPHLTFTKLELPLTSAELTTKEKAIALYPSQLRAFNAVGDDILAESTAFTNKRCEKAACEVVYKISAKK